MSLSIGPSFPLPVSVSQDDQLVPSYFDSFPFDDHHVSLPSGTSLVWRQTPRSADGGAHFLTVFDLQNAQHHTRAKIRPTIQTVIASPTNSALRAVHDGRTMSIRDEDEERVVRAEAEFTERIDCWRWEESGEIVIVSGSGVWKWKWSENGSPVKVCDRSADLADFKVVDHIESCGHTILAARHTDEEGEEIGKLQVSIGSSTTVIDGFAPCILSHEESEGPARFLFLRLVDSDFKLSFCHLNDGGLDVVAESDNMRIADDDFPFATCLMRLRETLVACLVTRRGLCIFYDIDRNQHLFNLPHFQEEILFAVPRRNDHRKIVLVTASRTILSLDSNDACLLDFLRVTGESGLDKVLLYASELLALGPLTVDETNELCIKLLELKRRDKLIHLITEGIIKCTAELGDLLLERDQEIALSIYIRAGDKEKLAAFQATSQCEDAIYYARLFGLFPGSITHGRFSRPVDLTAPLYNAYDTTADLPSPSLSVWGEKRHDEIENLIRGLRGEQSIRMDPSLTTLRPSGLPAFPLPVATSTPKALDPPHFFSDDLPPPPPPRPLHLKEQVPPARPPPPEVKMRPIAEKEEINDFVSQLVNRRSTAEASIREETPILGARSNYRQPMETVDSLPPIASIVKFTPSRDNSASAQRDASAFTSIAPPPPTSSLPPPSIFPTPSDSSSPRHSFYPTLSGK